MSLTVTDLFCGGGGSSTGAVQVPGVEIRMAANHWKLAVEVHNSNHPNTDHATADLHLEDPRFFPKTDLLWASPECTKWSQANGSKPLPAIEEGLFEDPLSDDAAMRSRLLMFDVLRFAEHHRYRAMVVENVVDVATQPKYALAWQTWQTQLAGLGYAHRVVSLNSMHAQALGLPAPQSRDRIYVVCWRKGDTAPDVERMLRPKAWCGRCETVIEARQAWKPGRVVGRYRQQYVYKCGGCGTTVEPGWLPAAAAIDWTLKGRKIGDRDKPLADKTRRRIAAGIARYWRPFHLEATGNQYDSADEKHRNFGDPNGYMRVWPIEEYLRVLHTGETKALAIPLEGRDGKEARPMGLPFRTLTTHDRYALITRHFSSRGDGAEMTTPAFEALRTLTTTAQQSVLTPGDLEAAEAQVDDCLFRMLEPHEVAAGMAFPDDYKWAGTRRERVKLAGNAVTPPAARDLIAAVAEALGGEAA